MRKIGEKVALVAQICIAVIFVLTAILYVVGVIPQANLEQNAVVLVIMIVLAVLFLGTSAYLIYMNFSALQNLKRILLHADSQCATTTNIKVVNKIARGCANKIEGVRVRKTKIRADEKNGYTATFVVVVEAPSITPVLEQLRCLVADSFEQTLGLTFNTITFEVAKLKSQQTVDVEKAKEQAEQIVENQQQAQDLYQNPTETESEASPTEIVEEKPEVETTPETEVVEEITPSEEKPEE